jgi:transposase
VAIVMGLDQHREQITYDLLDTETGEVRRGRIRPADRNGVRRFLEGLAGERVEVAVEATTGWRFVVEELIAAGATPHLAEPAETRARRGPKRRAKTDRQDARHLRELLQQGRLPESWIAPTHILELRSKVRLRRALVAERTEWQQRIQAQLFHHGVPARQRLLRSVERRAWLESLELPDAARMQITVALAMIDELNRQLALLERELRQIARSWPGPRALQAAHYGIGPTTAVAIVAELGDCRRFSSARKAVRYAGWDITVSQSDRRRAPGKLSRQGPETLRWATDEAANTAVRVGAPDHADYLQLAERLGGNRARVAVARKLLRRSYHTLRQLGQEALQSA